MPLPQKIKDSLQILLPNDKSLLTALDASDAILTPQNIATWSEIFKSLISLYPTMFESRENVYLVLAMHEIIDFLSPQIFNTSQSLIPLDMILDMADFDIKLCFYNLGQSNLDKESLRKSIVTSSARVLEQVKIIESYSNAGNFTDVSILARCKKLRSFAMLLNSNLPNLDLLNAALKLIPEDNKQQCADILNHIGNTALWLATICFNHISKKDLEAIETHPFVRMALKYHNDVDIYKTRYENDANSLVTAAVDAYRRAFWLDTQGSASKAAQKSLQCIIGHPICSDDPTVHTINDLAPQPVLLLRPMPRAGSLSTLSESVDEDAEDTKDDKSKKYCI